MDAAVTDPAPPPEDPHSDAAEAAADRLLERLWRPRATLALAGALVACHLAVGAIPYLRGNTGLLGVVIRLRGPRLLRRCGAMHGPSLDQGELWRLVSASFLHVEGVHLLVNTLSLLGLGALCEAVFGPTRLVWLFLVAGAAGASLSWVAGNPLSVGASSAVFGMMGAAIVFGWQRGDALPDDIRRWFRWRLLPWLILNLLLGFLPFIDAYGHVGGLIGGSLLALSLHDRVTTTEPPAGELTGGLAAASALALLWGAAGVAGEWR